jgi:hypothetical protein
MGLLISVSACHLGVNITLANHADHLGANVCIGSGLLAATRRVRRIKFIHCSIGAVWHGARMPGHAAEKCVNQSFDTLPP